MKTAKQVCKDIDATFLKSIIEKVQNHKGSFAFDSKSLVDDFTFEVGGLFSRLIFDRSYFTELSKGKHLDKLRKLGFQVKVSTPTLNYEGVECNQVLKPVLRRIFSGNKLESVWRKVAKSETISRIEITACCGKKHK